MASWVREFNNLEREYNNIMLDKAVEIYDKHISSFAIANENLEEIKFCIECKFETLNEEVNFTRCASEYIEKMHGVLNNNALTDIKTELDSMMETLIKSIKEIDYNNILNKKEQRIFCLRANKFLAKSKNILINFSMETMEKYINLNQFICDYIQDVVKRVDKLIKNKKQMIINNIQSEMQLQDVVNKKIFDFKEMIKLANKEGYEHKRTTGDHMIFQHDESQKIIVIPAHSLGYGLMLEIQKQIRENKIA